MWAIVCDLTDIFVLILSCRVNYYRWWERVGEFWHCGTPPFLARWHTLSFPPYPILALCHTTLFPLWHSLPLLVSMALPMYHPFTPSLWHSVTPHPLPSPPFHSHFSTLHGTPSHPPTNPTLALLPLSIQPLAPSLPFPLAPPSPPPLEESDGLYLALCSSLAHFSFPPWPGEFIIIHTQFLISISSLCNCQMT